jgi:hypothetical protein
MAYSYFVARLWRCRLMKHHNVDKSSSPGIVIGQKWLYIAPLVSDLPSAPRLHVLTQYVSIGGFDHCRDRYVLPPAAHKSRCSGIQSPAVLTCRASSHAYHMPSINTQNAQYKWLTREDLPQLAHILPSLNVAQISVHDVVRTARPVWANPFGGLCHRLRYRHIDRYSHVLGPAQQQHCVRAVRRGISSTPCSV